MRVAGHVSVFEGETVGGVSCRIGGSLQVKRIDMSDTRSSLLLRMRDRSDSEAWGEFHKLYTPLLYRYARSRGLCREDAEEVRDQCLEQITRKIPSFEYDRRKGGFKNWLFRMARGKVIDLLRKHREQRVDSQVIQAVADSASAPEEHWAQIWKMEHLKFCVEQLRGSVSEKNYQAFCMLLFEGSSVTEVCERLHMKPDHVYKARFRVLERVRALMSELDPDSDV